MMTESNVSHLHPRLGSGAWLRLKRSTLLLFVRVSTLATQVAEEATGQGHPANAVERAIAIMAVRGEVQEKNRGFLLYRLR